MKTKGVNTNNKPYAKYLSFIYFVILKTRYWQQTVNFKHIYELLMAYITPVLQSA